MTTWYLIAFVIAALVILYPADASLALRWIELQFSWAKLGLRKLWLFLTLTPRIWYDRWQMKRTVAQILKERDEFNGDKID
jgi:hypothetical protein